MFKLKPNKPIRYIVYLQGDFPEDRNNVVNYSTKLDKILGMPTSFSQAVHTACRYFGVIDAEYEDGTLELVRDYR